MKKSAFLPNLSVNRPITVIMMLTTLLVVGAIAYTKIKVELMPPGFTAPFLFVNVPYRDANPQEVEEQITRPIEEILQTVRYVRKISSQSGTSGSRVFIMFDQKADMRLAYNEVRDRVERARPELPDDVERILVRKFDNENDPILWFGISLEKDFLDPYYLVDNFIKRPLERIDGVANVDISGIGEKMILVDLDQTKIKALKIDIFPLIQSLRSDNFAMPSGYLSEGGKKIYIRSLGKFGSLEEIQNLQVKGTDILLKDIASIRFDEPEVRWTQRIDGKKAVRIGVFKESMANTVDLNEQLLKVLNEEIIPNKALEGMNFSVFFDQGKLIMDSINNLQSAGMWGGLFAFFIILFFIRRIRITLLVTLAIPLSLVITMSALYFIGWSLNLATLMGMMICVGLVIDNSIVIVENIQRRRMLGDNSKEAALTGAGEVSLAVTMATLTTVVVFLPLMLMNDSGGMAFWMLRIGIPVISALLGSLVVALVFIPLIANRLPSPKNLKESRLIIWQRRIYGKFLNWTLNHRFDAALIALALLISIQIPIQFMDKTDNNNGNIGNFELYLDMPNNYTLQEANDYVKVIEDYIEENREKYRVRTVDSRFRNNFGNINVYTKEDANNAWWYVFYRNSMRNMGFGGDRLELSEMAEDVKNAIPEYPGVEVRTQWWSNNDKEKSVSVFVYGRDTNTLLPLAKEVERRLKLIPDLLNIETDLEKTSDEIHIGIDRTLAKKYNVDPQQIGQMVSYVVRGIDLPDYRTDDKDIDVRVQLQKEDRENLDQLKAFTITSPNGKEIPLATFVKFNVNKGLGSIRRTDGQTYLEVKAYTAEDNIEEIYKEIDRVMAGFDLPRGYTWNKGDRFFDFQTQNNATMFAMILAVTFVFILMGVLFESFILPMTIIVCIPFSLFGAFWFLYITGTPFDIMAGIGLIILIGVVVNNAIVLVDLINRLRKEGMSRHDAIMEAGKNRFRPILMTALTTICGLIPMALGNSSLIGIPYAPLGRVMMGGLLTSTVFTLVFIPLAYVYLDNLRETFNALFHKITLRLSSGKELQKTS